MSSWGTGGVGWVRGEGEADITREHDLPRYYGFQTVCKCPFRALLVILATDSNQSWAN